MTNVWPAAIAEALRVARALSASVIAIHARQACTRASLKAMPNFICGTAFTSVHRGLRRF